jgi:hypothetical protein
MKILKITFITLVAVVLCAFVYANVREVSPVKKLKKVHLVSFELIGNLSPEEKSTLENKISTTSGVTACSVSKEGNIASVVFYPEVISENILADDLSVFNQVSVKPIAFPQTGGCPVHQVTASVDRMISALDLRD